MAPAEYSLPSRKVAAKSKFESELTLSKSASRLLGTMVRGMSPNKMCVGDGRGGEGDEPVMESKRFHSWLDGDDEVGTGGE